MTHCQKNGTKYLTFASTNESKEILKKYTELWNDIKYLIKTINQVNMEKIFHKIQFNSDDDLPLSQQLKCQAVAIIIRSVFEENGKYPQIF